MCQAITNEAKSGRQGFAVLASSHLSTAFAVIAALAKTSHDTRIYARPQPTSKVSSSLVLLLVAIFVSMLTFGGVGLALMADAISYYVTGESLF